MRAFVDSSTLLKKYKIEDGTSTLLELLNEVTDIIVSPVTYIEMINAVNRFSGLVKLSDRTRQKITAEIDVDFGYFLKVPLDEKLESITARLARQYQLKSLELIQLSAAITAGPELFLTSDQQLFKAAQNELKNVRLI